MQCNIKSHQNSVVEKICTFSKCQQSRLACSECFFEFHQEHSENCCDLSVFFTFQKQFLQQQINGFEIVLKLVEDLISQFQNNQNINFLRNQIEYYLSQKQYIQLDINQSQIFIDIQSNILSEEINLNPKQDQQNVEKQEIKEKKQVSLIKTLSQSIVNAVSFEQQNINQFNQSKDLQFERMTQDSKIFQQQSIIKNTRKDQIQESELFQTGLNCFEQTQFQEALQIFDMIVSQNQNFERAWIQKILTEAQLQDFDTTLKSCEKAIKIFPNSIDILFLFGLILEETKNFKQALEKFQKVLYLLESNQVKQSQIIESLLQAGLSSIQLQQYGDAVEYLKKILIIDPNREDVQFLIGQIYMEQKNYEEALNYFSISQNSEAIFNYSICLKQTGNYVSAFREVEKFCELNPQNINGQLLKGEILYYQKKHDQATNLFAELIQKMPELEESINLFLINLSQQS